MATIFAGTDHIQISVQMYNPQSVLPFQPAATMTRNEVRAWLLLYLSVLVSPGRHLRFYQSESTFLTSDLLWQVSRTVPAKSAAAPAIVRLTTIIPKHATAQGLIDLFELPFTDGNGQTYSPMGLWPTEPDVSARMFAAAYSSTPGVVVDHELLKKHKSNWDDNRGKRCLEYCAAVHLIETGGELPMDQNAECARLQRVGRNHLTRKTTLLTNKKETWIELAARTVKARGFQ
jgi:hypothetical protein